MRNKICYNNKMKGFTETVLQLENLEKRGIHFSLSRVRVLCRYFGNPQDRLKVIHVTGTNGKGSVCAFTARILAEAGFRVGLYTSPHLSDIRERIQINRAYISEEDFSALSQEINGAIAKTKARLTYFEFLTLMAFLYFKRQQTDFVVLEVGMGGRLDATNIVREPLACVITNIAYEHTEYLGSTLAAIACEKAAIIKNKTYVITGVQQPQIVKILRNVCAKKAAVLWLADKDIPLPEGEIGIAGDYQRGNAACAVGAIRAIQKQGIKIAEKAITKGLQKTFWPGRLEVFKLVTHDSRPVTVLLDGAHNPAAAESLAVNLGSKLFHYRELILVFGVLSDKDYREIISLLGPLADKVILVEPKSARALPVGEMRALWEEQLTVGNIFIRKNTGDGFALAKKLSGKRDLICVTGSLYVVGEAREIISFQKGKRRWQM